MTNYLDNNETIKILNSLDRCSDNKFIPIEISNFKLNISAGPLTLSEPRKRFGKLRSYESVQLELVESFKGEDILIRPLDDNRFKKFSWAQYFSYENLKNKTYASFYGGYVPIEIIPTIIREIYKVSRLKIFF